MSIADNIKNWATNNLPLIFSVLRVVKPNVQAKGFALITRYHDVQEALSRPDALGVTYAEKMGKLTDGSNFFLGMNNTANYTRDVSNMRLVARHDDIENMVVPIVNKACAGLVTGHSGKMEMVSQLTKIVPCQFSAEYLGVPGPSVDELFDWCSSMFQYLFYPGNPSEFDQKAEANGAKTRAYLDSLILMRKQEAASGRVKDDVLGRCLDLQASGTPGMSDVDIRNNLLGILIGLMPTTSKCAVLMLDYLLDNPQLLAGAQKAAREDDDELLRKYMLESLRLNSFGAGVFRVATQDYKIASGYFRSTTIKKGTQVLVSTQSAMLDGRVLKQPKQFKLNRPDYNYMHWGYGMHTCFGQYINQVQIPLIVKSILKQDGLKRADGEAGKVIYDGPFPIKMNIEFIPTQVQADPKGQTQQAPQEQQEQQKQQAAEVVAAE
jgi:cytochrome P450